MILMHGEPRTSPWARLVALLTLTMTVLVVHVAPASAGPPMRDRLSFTATGVDWDLSEACGVTVTSTQTGRVTWTVHGESWEPGLILVINVAITWTYSAGDNDYRARQAFVSKMQLQPDGTLIAMTAGNQPLHQSGVVKADFNTGQLILEKGGGSPEWRRICAALTA